MRILAALLLAALPAQALSVCEPRTEVRQILDENFPRRPSTASNSPIAWPSVARYSKT
jgi:hypothetical protein